MTGHANNNALKKLCIIYNSDSLSLSRFIQLLQNKTFYIYVVNVPSCKLSADWLRFDSLLYRYGKLWKC